MTQFISDKQLVSRQEVLTHLRISSASDAAERYALSRLLNRGEVTHIGRNQYCIDDVGKIKYKPNLSSYAEEIAQIILSKLPLLDWRLFETVALNEFVNHQIAQNTVILEAEPMLVASVNSALREVYKDRVLVQPRPKDFDYYWQEDSIVIMKLTSEAPRDSAIPFGTTVEKIIVDLFANKTLMSMISKGEYTTIIEDAFNRYHINEKSMFRYARRRSADKRLESFVENETHIKLLPK